MSKEDKQVYLVKLGEETSILRKAVIDQLGNKLMEIADIMSGVIGSGGKILIAGNGGSAAMASHFAAEMVVRLTAEKNRQSLPAVALCVDPAVMTAAANDYGYDKVFARQVEGLGQKGDMLFVMSTSGNSPNLLEAVRVAHKIGMITTALLGGNGGKLGKSVERALVIPHTSTQRIQEEHLFAVHSLVEMVESDLFA